jgi:NADPH:quinone reductase-like Zn-dependent oxidoreductase
MLGKISTARNRNNCRVFLKSRRSPCQRHSDTTRDDAEYRLRSRHQLRAGGLHEERQRYDLILDTKTNRSLFAYLRVLTPGGTYVTVCGETATLFQFLIFGGLIRLLRGKKIVVIKLKQNAHLADLKECFEAGHLAPVIDGPYKLSDWQDAFRHFSTANHEGKVILTVV